MSEKFKDILDFCVKHQLQRHKPRFLNIFAIRPFHSGVRITFDFLAVKTQ